MKPRDIVLIGLGALVIGSLIVSSRNRGSQPPPAQATTQPAPPAAAAMSDHPPHPPDPGRVPNFHKTLADAGELPRILPAEQFKIPIVAKAYRIAARIPGVLAQQPCYCYCDKVGHGSLVDCFATDHGAG